MSVDSANGEASKLAQDLLLESVLPDELRKQLVSSHMMIIYITIIAYFLYPWIIIHS